MLKILKYHLPLVLSLLVIFVLSSIPADSLPNFTFEVSDKLIHVLVYFILSLTFIYSLKNQNISFKLSENAILFAFIFSTLYGITDELHQYFVPNRSCDFYDVLADSLGALIGCSVIFFFNKLGLINKSKKDFSSKQIFEIKEDL